MAARIYVKSESGLGGRNNDPNQGTIYEDVGSQRRRADVHGPSLSANPGGHDRVDEENQRDRLSGGRAGRPGADERAGTQEDSRWRRISLLRRARKLRIIARQDAGGH